MLSKYVSENQRDWDQSLALVMLAYRSSVHYSTGFTPNMLFMGREPKLKIDLLMGSPQDEKAYSIPNYPQYLEKMRSNMYRIQNLAKEKPLQASEGQKRDYDLGKIE